MGSASSTGMAPLCDAVGKRRPLDQLHEQRLMLSHRLLQAVQSGRNVRMTFSRREDFGLSLKPGETLRIVPNASALSVP